MKNSRVLDTHESDEKSERKNELLFAIVGASYGGLTIANVLHKYNEKRNKSDPYINFTIFEKMGPPGSVGSISGNIDLPSAKKVLGKIGMGEIWDEVRNGPKSVPSAFPNVHTTTTSNFTEELDERHCNNSSSSLVPQHAFVEALRENVQSRIQYRKEILNIFTRREPKRNNKGYIPHDVEHHDYFLQIQCSDNKNIKKVIDTKRFVTVKVPTYETLTRGPFHIVIAADGVLSKCRQQILSRNHIQNSPSNVNFVRSPVFFIGDARWAQTRWWDLGCLRIQSGADISIRDGLELGELLVDQVPTIRKSMRQRQSCYENIATNKLSKFTIQRSKWVDLAKSVLAFSLSACIMAIILAHFNMCEIRYGDQN